MDLEEQISKAEAEKTNRDHAMRSLNDEISGLDELISKLNKEKKFFQVTDLTKQNKTKQHFSSKIESTKTKFAICCTCVTFEYYF